MPSPVSTRTNGQTIDQTWFNLMKEWIEYLDASVGAVDSEIQRYTFTNRSLNDHLVLPASGIIMVPVERDITLLDAEICVLSAGTAGTLEVGFDYKSGVGAWTSVLTTNPSLAYGAGSLVKSTNGVVDPLNDEIDAGDFIRLNVVQNQTDLRFWVAQLTWVKRG
jgi:hypothetical protein